MAQSIDSLLRSFQTYLDGSVDRRYGIDTSGLIPLKDLTIEGHSTNDGIWYEPMSVKIFKQIMLHLKIDFGEFEFIDLGSGKGRVLLFASDYGFRRITGVEFARELHIIATNNVTVWNSYTGRQNVIRTICIDAAEFVIPEGQLVVFFYSPFRGMTMKRVIENICNSFNCNPRTIVIVFYGDNPQTIELLKETGFHWGELTLRADWSRLTKYRAFLFTTFPDSIAR